MPQLLRIQFSTSERSLRAIYQMKLDEHIAISHIPGDLIYIYVCVCVCYKGNISSCVVRTQVNHEDKQHC